MYHLRKFALKNLYFSPAYDVFPILLRNFAAFLGFIIKIYEL